MDEWRWGPPIVVSHLDYVARQRRDGLDPPLQVEILLQYGDQSYSAVISDEGDEGAVMFGDRWLMGISLERPGMKSKSLLESGVAAYPTFDDALVSAMLTVVAYAGGQAGSWREVRRPQSE